MTKIIITHRILLQIFQGNSPAKAILMAENKLQLEFLFPASMIPIMQNAKLQLVREGIMPEPADTVDLDTIMQRIRVVPEKEFDAYRVQASILIVQREMGEYVAVGLALHIPEIWDDYLCFIQKSAPMVQISTEDLRLRVERSKMGK